MQTTMSVNEAKANFSGMLSEVESARRCWFHEHRSADHAETFNLNSSVGLPADAAFAA